MRNPWIRRALAAALAAMTLVLLMGAAAAVLPYSLSYNHTASLPQGFYLSEKPNLAQLQPGDLVCFKRVLPQWAQGRKNYGVEGIDLCKAIVGVPGDQVERLANGRIQVSGNRGTRDGGTVAAQDSRGQPMYGAELPSVIPADHYYVAIPRLQTSLDSRYLGLIPAQNISRKVRPLLTW